MAPKGFTDRDGHLEAGLLRSTPGEKQTGYREFTPTRRDRNKNRMLYLRRALLIVAVGFVLGLGVATARPSFSNCKTRHDNKANMAVAQAHGADGELAEALQKASPDLLHRLLHAYLPERYQHGVFASDRDAIHAISGDDPSVASAIVQIAKRQEDTPNSNSTIPNSQSSTSAPPSAPPSSSSSEAPSSTSAGPSSTPDTSQSSKLLSSL